MTAEDKRSTQMAEVLRLHLVEGKGIRAIAKATKLTRKTVRKLLGLASGKDKPKPAQIGRPSSPRMTSRFARRSTTARTCPRRRCWIG